MGATIKDRGSRALRVLLAFALALSAAVGISTADKAYATEAALVESDQFFDFYQYDSNTNNHWQDEAFYLNGDAAYCIDITSLVVRGSTYSSQAMPADMAKRLGLYKKYLDEAHGDWSGLKRGGYFQYMVWCEYTPGYMSAYVTPDNADFFGVYDSAKAYYQANKDLYEAEGTEWVSASSQSMCVTPRLIPHGAIELTKASAHPDLTASNACYTLAGAEYSIYSDPGLSGYVGKITTDANGYGKAENLKAGTYWVKETLASAGYAKDELTYLVEMGAGQTAAVNGGTVVEVPHSDPVGMLVGKLNATTNANVPEGAASLENAEFTAEYYDGYYDSAEAARASGSAKNTWTFKTDSDGFSYFADEFKVSGDDLYYQMNGTTACLPLGTVLITETKAPAGYNLDDGNHNAPKTFCVKITDGGAVGEDVYTYNSPVVPDTVKRGDYRLMKEVPTNNDEEDQELTRIAVEGVQFQIVNDNAKAVASPDTGEPVAPGGVVTTITTDENGFATTKDHRQPGWTGALAYGNYTIHEVIPADVSERVKAEYGITLIGVDDWKITVSTEAQYDLVQIVANHIPQTPLRIEKVDSTTGKAIPLACSFQLYDEAGELVTYTDRYADEVIDTWTTLSTGACTLPMKLDEGTYRLHEVQAPEGYVLGTADIEFAVDEYRTWDDPITLTYADAPIRAEIEILKTDGVTEVPVEGAEYCIKAEGDVATGDGTVRFSDGQIVGYVTTDAEGRAAIDGLYLGNYVAYETKSPEGWALDTQEHHLSIASQGQLVPIVVEALGVADMPTTCKLLKVDSTDASKALEGATFHIWQVVEGVDADDIDPGFSVSYETDVTTGADGTADVSYLPHGKYLIEETDAPEGYFVAEGQEPLRFQVDDQGFIGLDEEGAVFGDTLELTFANAPTILDITKTDATTGVELAGATLTLADKDGNVVDEWVSTTEAHRIVGIEPGDYTLTETIAPEGYLMATSIEFTVEATGDVQKVEMKDDYTKVDFSKTDIATGDELSGAHLQVIGKDDKVVAEWDTDGKIHRINGLEPGDYTLRETTAPEGYEVAEDVRFTVEATGDIQKVEMKDKATPAPEAPSSTMPETGDSLPWWAFIAVAGGAASIAVALAAGHKIRKRQSITEDDGADQ